MRRKNGKSQMQRTFEFLAGARNEQHYWRGLKLPFGYCAGHDIIAYAGDEAKRRVREMSKRGINVDCYRYRRVIDGRAYGVWIYRMITEPHKINPETVQMRSLYV